MTIGRTRASAPPSEVRLWVGNIAMVPDVVRTTARRDGTGVVESEFSVSLPAEALERDAACGRAGEAFTAVVLVAIGAHSVTAVTAHNERIVSSFVFKRRLAAVIDNVFNNQVIRFSFEFAPIATSVSTRATPDAKRLQRFGHSFVLEKHRAPCVSEVAVACGIDVDRARALLRATRSPFCADDVQTGALPRLMVPEAERELPVAAQPSVEQIAQDFTVTRERIRPIEAAALKKLRHPSRSKRLRSFIDS